MLKTSFSPFSRAIKRHVQHCRNQSWMILVIPLHALAALNVDNPGQRRAQRCAGVRWLD